VKARDCQRSLLSKCNLQECLSCVYWIICLHASFAVLSTTGAPVLMKHQVDIPLQGAKAWHLILSKYTRVSTGKIDLLTVSLDVFCDGAWHPEGNPSIMHGKGKREPHQWTEANKLVKKEFAQMNQLYCLLQEGHRNWPLPLQSGQGVLSLGSEERALKNPSVTWPRPLHFRHGSFVTPPHSSHNFKDLQQLLTKQNSQNLIRTPVIWARKQEMKKRIAI